MTKYVIGIDPGLNGAFAILDNSLGKGWDKSRIVTVQDFPVCNKSIDAYALSTAIEIHSKSIGLAIVEEVGVMTGLEGRVSMFNFGFGAGIVKGILATCNIPIVYVKPSVWKLSLGLGRDKNKSREKVMKLFPESASLFSRKKDDGRAEAVLLGWFGKNFLL